MGSCSCFNQLSIDGWEVAELVKLAAVGAFARRAVAAEIGEVDFATGDENRTQECDKELGLRFAKPPTFASRLCTIAIRLFIRCVFYYLHPRG